MPQSFMSAIGMDIIVAEEACVIIMLPPKKQYGTSAIYPISSSMGMLRFIMVGDRGFEPLTPSV